MMTTMIIEVGAKILRERGIRVLEFGALQPIGHLVEAVKESIQNLK